jgi:TolB protein
MKYLPSLIQLFASLTLLLDLPVRAAEPKIIIERPFDPLGFLKPVPVSISGFSGEPLNVLKDDLIFMGIVEAPTDQAKYLISGSASGNVTGRVVEKVTKGEVLNKAYAGSTTRAQIHAFADDIAKALTQLPGIAQSKITFKVETSRDASEVYIADYDGHGGQAVTRDGAFIGGPVWGGPSLVLYASYKLGAPYIFSQNLRTGARQSVARYPGGAYSPAVSRDGRRVAMILSKAGSPDLYVANIDGSGLKQLTFTREAESSPCWSPDSQTICYVSRETQRAALYKISASGGSSVRLPTPGAPSPTEPDWSPDGKWIAFTSLTGGFQIFILRVSDGSVHGPFAQGEDPSWAPNSRALIFCTGPDHRKNLSLLDVPTYHVKTVARVLESNSQPSWAK